MADDPRWVAPPFDEWTDKQQERAEEVYQQRRAGPTRFERDDESQLRDSAIAYVAVEIVYRRRLPGWVRVRGPRAWHLFVDKMDPADVAYVHVYRVADGRLKPGGWCWGYEAPTLGTWNTDVRHHAWSVSPLRLHSPPTFVQALAYGRTEAVLAHGGQKVGEPQEPLEQQHVAELPERPRKPEQLAFGDGDDAA